MAVMQVVPGADDRDQPDVADVQRLASQLPADETHFLYSIVLHGRTDLAVAPDEYSGLVMVLLRMLAFAPGDGAGSTRLGGSDASPTRSAPEPVRRDGGYATPVALAARAPTAGSVAGERWYSVVSRMVESARIGALVRELAMQAQCTGIDEAARPPVWRLRVERDTLRSPAHVDKLEAALSEQLGEPVQLDVQLGNTDDSPAQREQLQREQAQREAERLIENDPVVRSLLNQYKGARIVPGSVKPH
jgi:DNA polymerase-3 subunit gamma/tau